MKRSRFSQILAGVLVNAIYEMKNYPIVLLSSVISPLSLLAVVTFVTNGSLFGTAIENSMVVTTSVACHEFVFSTFLTLRNNI